MKTTNIKPYLAEKCQVGLLFLRDKLIKFFSIFMYQTLYKMPLGKYIDVVVDKNFKSLRRMPFPCPLFAYLAQFGKLQVEYSELSGNKEMQGRITKQDEVNFIKYQIFFFSHALKLLLSGKVDEDVKEFFSKNGFEGSTEEIANAVSGELMGLKSNLDDLELLLKAETPQDTGKVSRADYSKTIAIANKNGYYLDYKSSVADFIHILGLQKEEISRLNKKK